MSPYLSECMYLVHLGAITTRYYRINIVASVNLEKGKHAKPRPSIEKKVKKKNNCYAKAANREKEKSAKRRPLIEKIENLQN